MQYNSDGGLDGFSRASKPQVSPWRGVNSATDDNTNGDSGLQYGQGLKIPNLPKLGSNNSSVSNTTRNPSQQQPSFAQAIQRAQKGPASGQANKSLNNRPVKAQPSQNSVPPSEPGAHILGSVNAQMMPRVNTSSGMSSLNTVLPGMADDNRQKISGDLRNQHHGIPHPPSVQNLSIADKQGDASHQVKHVESDKYVLKSLLGLMDHSNKEKQSVVLGSDLSQSGLNLGSSSERLSHTFASPWQEMSKHIVVPDYKLPECYRIDTVVPQQQKLQNFDEGALFYIFYTMPRDAMQEAAAVELTNRSWRYHKELKMWLTKDPLSEPIQTNNQEESGIYIFFDPTTWKKIKREYILYYPDIA